MPDILRHLLQSIRGFAVHNPDVQSTSPMHSLAGRRPPVGACGIATQG